MARLLALILVLCLTGPTLAYGAQARHPKWRVTYVAHPTGVRSGGYYIYHDNGCAYCANQHPGRAQPLVIGTQFQTFWARYYYAQGYKHNVTHPSKRAPRL